MVPEILNSLALNLNFLRRMVADLDDGQMVGQVGGVVNHPAWTIGHLVGSFQLMGGELGMTPWLPENWAQWFGTGTTPVGHAGVYPGKEDLLQALDDGQRRLVETLASMSAADLARPLPDANYRDRLPTIGHAILHILASHAAMHVGQLAAWRRAMGLPVVREPLNDAPA
ncbi:MAG: DinB family protein [Planctomycetia bacterium]|nr:DinB family protein [Planctomycetia bacterium]